MLIDNTQECDEVWDKIYAILKFNPSCSYRDHSMIGILPFEINLPYSVYAIDSMTDKQLDLMDEWVRNSLVACTDGRKEWYALDWQHSTFRFDPQKIEEQQSVWVEDERYFGGGYNAYFPSFYPDGDYHFFIDVDFKNGYLGHPWRQEIWIFGAKLEEEIKKIYKELGWKRIN
ncbi:MAG: DUF2716 domain-containing protein [Clostridiales bacterium]|nr:DUF2716 domain-containing protein [Clostridiales bacterium]